MDISGWGGSEARCSCKQQPNPCLGRYQMAPCCPPSRRNSSTWKHPRTTMFWPLPSSLVLSSTTLSCALHAPDVSLENPVLIHSFSLHPQGLCIRYSLCLEPFLLLHLSGSFFSFRVPLGCYIFQEAFLAAYPPTLQSGQLGATARAPASPLYVPHHGTCRVVW